MNKIIEVALTGKFGTEAVTSLMEVIGATPNPEMATEILLGVYVQPEIPNAVVNAKGLEKTLVSVDYWTNTVYYSYEEEVRKHIYVHVDTDTSLITLENYKEYMINYSDANSTAFSFSTGEFRQTNSQCSIQDWLSQDVKDYGLAV
jgi:hypothetical protein